MVSAHGKSEDEDQDHGDVLDWLVAHRGWPDRYAENSLEGVQAVLEAGARWIEFDVQISADGQILVIHDDELSRLAGRSIRVTQSDWAELQGVLTRSACGATAPIPRLEDMLALIGRFPGARAFVELKRHSIEHHGLDSAVRQLLTILAQAPCPVVFISFSWRAAWRMRQLSDLPVGWVFKPWSPLARWQAERLKPDYLFVRADRVPSGQRPFWPGPWQWVIYDVAELAQARDLRARGASLIEVDDLPGLLRVGDGNGRP